MKGRAAPSAHTGLVLSCRFSTAMINSIVRFKRCVMTELNGITGDSRAPSVPLGGWQRQGCSATDGSCDTMMVKVIQQRLQRIRDWRLRRISCSRMSTAYRGRDAAADVFAVVDDGAVTQTAAVILQWERRFAGA